MNNKYNIKSSPIWPFEVVNFLLEVKLEKEKEIIKNHNSFGKTKEEVEKFFQAYLEYKNILKEEVLPIYYEYPTLEIAFKVGNDEEDNQAELVRFITSIKVLKYDRPLLNEDRGKIVEEAILEILRDSFVDLKDNAEIKSLSHLLKLLENTGKTAEEKLQLISLYENRYNFMLELEEFTNRVIPIFKAHYPIISNDFDNALNLLEETRDLSAILPEVLTINFPNAKETNISIGIFSFNQLSVGYDNSILNYSIGIYFFILGELKEKYSSYEEALLSDLKALGDNTRLSIMYNLGKKPMYTQELAEELDLTPATISHHIDILLKNELISITMDVEKGKRIYYEINKNKLKSLGLAIESIGEEKERSSDYGRKNQISIS